MAKTKTRMLHRVAVGAKWQANGRIASLNTLEETIAEAAPSETVCEDAEGGKLQRLSEVQAREE